MKHKGNLPYITDTFLYLCVHITVFLCILVMYIRYVFPFDSLVIVLAYDYFFSIF